MYKKISSIILWVSHKARKNSAPDENEEYEGGLGSPYSRCKWMNDYYGVDKEKKPLS